MDTDETFTATRTSLHGVAELLLAGPQHAVSGTITLRARPGGFATTRQPDVSVAGTSVRSGDRTVEIDGCTARELGEALGVGAATLSHVYKDGSGVGLDDVLSVDRSAAERIAHAFGVGDEALRTFAPDSTAILWPEHFDLAVALDGQRVNLGISPGDASSDQPYMYVGPWDPRPLDGFWNQPFGAARELPEDVGAVVAFFDEGCSRLSR